MKKTIVLIMIVAMTFLVACKKTDDTVDNKTQTKTETEEAETSQSEKKVYSKEDITIYNGRGESLEGWVTNGMYIEDKVYSNVPSFISNQKGDVIVYETMAQAIITYGSEEDKDLEHDALIDKVMESKLNTFFSQGMLGGDVISYSQEQKEELKVDDMPVTHYNGVIECGVDGKVRQTHSYEAYCFTFNGYTCIMMGVVEYDLTQGDESIPEYQDAITKNLAMMINNVRDYCDYSL